SVGCRSLDLLDVLVDLLVRLRQRGRQVGDLARLVQVADVLQGELERAAVRGRRRGVAVRVRRDVQESLELRGGLQLRRVQRVEGGRHVLDRVGEADDRGGVGGQVLGQLPGRVLLLAGGGDADDRAGQVAAAVL